LNVIPSLLHKNHTSSIFTILNFVWLVLLPKLINKYLKLLIIALGRFTSAKLLPESYIEMKNALKMKCLQVNSSTEQKRYFNNLYNLTVKQQVRQQCSTFVIKVFVGSIILSSTRESWFSGLDGT
jgi:hypothetical protein